MFDVVVVTFELVIAIFYPKIIANFLAVCTETNSVDADPVLTNNPVPPTSAVLALTTT
jgi:hypothetical protein